MNAYITYEDREEEIPIEYYRSGQAGMTEIWDLEKFPIRLVSGPEAVSRAPNGDVLTLYMEWHRGNVEIHPHKEPFKLETIAEFDGKKYGMNVDLGAQIISVFDKQDSKGRVYEFHLKPIFG